ncbi:MAG: hypothetical protein K0R40_128 [Burkholderiales bacterium]|nr:hypothetical protein [Burkholderiales bacterium]
MLGVVLVAPELELAPPDAESFLVVSEDEEDEDDGALGVVVLPDAEPDALPEGELGVVVLEPDDAPELGVVVRDVPALSPHAVNILAPNARDTATARVESLIRGPPWLG